MLPAAHRLRSSGDFATTIRSGVRVGGPVVVLHARLRSSADTGPRIGFVVSKAVGGAVQRNRVKRRLRHAVAAEIDSLPRDLDLVVRALPAAAQSDDLAGQLAASLERSRRRLGVPAR